jgi:hypothetical protein
VIGSCTSQVGQWQKPDFLGNGTTSIPATNAVFGDPCGGTLKDCLASYAEPLVAGLQLQLQDQYPLVVLVLILYLWSRYNYATTGFTAAAGTNNLINYTSGRLHKLLILENSYLQLY